VTVSTVVAPPIPPESGEFLVVAAAETFPDPDVAGPFDVRVYAAGELPTDPAQSEVLRVVSNTVSGWVCQREIDGTGPRTILVGDGVQLILPTQAQILDGNTSDVQVKNTTTDTIVYSYVVPGGLLGTKGAIRMDVSAKFNNATGVSRNLTFKVTYGGTNVYVGVLGVSTDAGGFRAVDAHLIFGANASTGHQKMTGLFSMGNNTGPTVGIGDLSGLSASYPFVGVDPAKDSTIDQTLAVWAKLSLDDNSLEFTKLFGYTTRVAY
jgi:hypothetical protein